MLRFRVWQLVPILGFHLLFISSAQAGLIVATDDLTLSGGSSGSVDVWIESDGLDPLQSFQIEMQITPVGTVNSLLQFASSQPDPTGEGNYVFSGNSGGYLAAFDSSQPEKLLVGDSTFDFSDVEINGTPKLLARINLVSSGTPSTTDAFSISLLPMSGDSLGLLLGASNTGFLDSSFNPVAFSSRSGVVTVTGTQTPAVPEPASGTLFVIGVLSLLGYGRRQWRGRRDARRSGEEMQF